MANTPARPIVSSEHLAASGAGGLSEVEYGLTLVNNAFSRWMVRCAAAAGLPDLSPMEVLILHNINHRRREKRLADICFMLNVEDTHTVNYAIKKLVKQKLVVGDKRGKEIFYATTKSGQAFCTAYGDVREECLLSSLKAMGVDDGHLHQIAATLRTLSGLYDQAARAATSL